MYEYNYAKLNGLIKEFFNTKKAFAKALGIGTTALYQRLNNTMPFTQNEILKSKELFELSSPEEVNAVFFNIK